MQTQQYTALPFHQQFHQAPQIMYHTLPNHCSATTGSVHDLRFSGGSLPYPHQEYQNFSHRGGSERQISSSLTRTSLGATGMEITGTVALGSAVFYPEEITDYHGQQSWQWPSGPDAIHGVPQVASTTCHPEAGLMPFKSSSDHSTVVFSPAAQLPTPASMAVLLNPHTRSEPPQNSFPAPIAQRTAEVDPAKQTEIVEEVAVLQSTSEGHSREKKHGCTMCHKRFDRPSTLRKHLLVHTGEKAFVCDTCGRRFGVASNLNRHVKRCILKPVNTSLAAANAPSVNSDTNSPASAHVAAEKEANKRIRQPSPSSSNTPSSSSSDHVQSPQPRPLSAVSQLKSPPHKRRRRAPSPSRWIPLSLKSFNLNPPESKKSTPVPLPPVRRNLPREERDSWDENVDSSPYHPSGWKGFLPGPGIGLGLGGKDVRNLNLGSNGGFMLGRVLIFD